MTEPFATVEVTNAANLVLADNIQWKRFELGACMAIYKWDNLETAVENQWGGADSGDKRDWMIGSVVELFESNTYVDSNDIEDRLLGIMEDEFGAVIEDDSALPVAVQVIQIYKECSEGNFATVDALYSAYQQKEEAKKASGYKPPAIKLQTATGEEDLSDDDDAEDEVDEEGDSEMQMDVESSEPAGPVIDEDGFELVQKKGSRRR